MKNMIKRIKETGITARVLFLYIILVFLPFFILIGFVSMTIRSNKISDMENTTQNTLNIAAMAIHTNMGNYEDASMSLYYDGTVDLLEKVSEGKALTETESEQIQNALDSLSNSNTWVQSVYLKLPDGETFYGGGTYAELMDLMNPYQVNIIDAGGKCIWYPTNALHGRASESKYILARSLNSTDNQYLGILYMVVSSQMIESSMGSLSTDYAEWYVTDKNGNIFYASDSDKIGQKLDISGISTKQRSTCLTLKDKNGKTYVTGASQLMDVQWFCISRIELNSLEHTVKLLITPLLLVSLIYILFLFLMLYMMRNYIFKPLNQLKSSMDDYARQNLEQKEISIVGIGEFKSLSSHFNSMTTRISKLMEQYKAEVDEKNRQKMNAMTAQLTPHFIYNALNTIKWIAVLNQQENIQKLVESLIYIFMNAARADDEGYTVKDELELIRNYSVIQKARFMNFNLVIDASEECMDMRIRKLLIQPAVENAIVHGFNRGKIKNSTVRVRVWADNELHITVEDDGIGFDVEAWRTAPEKKSNHTNIGIHNVEEIIALEYGEGYSMQINSVKNLGTTVTYLLPIIRRDEYDPDNHS